VTRRSNKGPLRKYTLLRPIGIERLRKKRLSVPGAFSSFGGGCEKLDFGLSLYDALASTTKSPETRLNADRFATVCPCW